MSDYGPSPNGRLYDRLENAIDKHFDKVNREIASLRTELAEARERLAVLDERVTGIQEVKHRMGKLEGRIDQVERGRALERGMAIGAGAGAGGLLGYVARFLGGG